MAAATWSSIAVRCGRCSGALDGVFHRWRTSGSPSNATTSTAAARTSTSAAEWLATKVASGSTIAQSGHAAGDSAMKPPGVRMRPRVDLAADLAAVLRSRAGAI